MGNALGEVPGDLAHRPPPAVSGTGRQVRMLGTAQATGFGYSRWEFGVYN